MRKARLQQLTHSHTAKPSHQTHQRTRYAQKAFAFSLAALALFGCLLLCSCANDTTTAKTVTDDETLAETYYDVEAKLANVQSFDEETIAEVFNRMYFQPEMYGVSKTGFAKAYYANFTYEIADAQEIGDTVTIDCVVNVPDMTATLTCLESAYKTYLDPTTTSDENDAAFLSAFMDAGIEQQTIEFSVAYVKNDEGVWEMNDDALFDCVLIGGYDPRQDLADDDI